MDLGALARDVAIQLLPYVGAAGTALADEVGRGLGTVARSALRELWRRLGPAFGNPPSTNGRTPAGDQATILASQVFAILQQDAGLAYRLMAIKSHQRLTTSVTGNGNLVQTGDNNFSVA
jgi:hypothetical protein